MRFRKPLVIGGAMERDRQYHQFKETNSADGRCWGQENATMLILMLAAAMTVAMLIATAFGLHAEAQRQRLEPRRIDRFGYRR